MGKLINNNQFYRIAIKGSPALERWGERMFKQLGPPKKCILNASKPPFSIVHV